MELGISMYRLFRFEPVKTWERLRLTASHQLLTVEKYGHNFSSWHEDCISRQYRKKYGMLRHLKFQQGVKHHKTLKHRFM